MKFLVVDDSLTMRRIIINALQRIGYNDTVEASDGKEALEKFDGSIGFVITDWNMPSMSGVEFARAGSTESLPPSRAARARPASEIETVSDRSTLGGVATTARTASLSAPADCDAWVVSGRIGPEPFG